MGLKIAMLSKYPLAGAPYEIVKCLNRYTDLQVRLVSVFDRYADGRIFPKDLLWDQDTIECIKTIKEADIIHIHNEVFPNVENLIIGKPVIATYHSVPVRPQVKELKKISQANYCVLQPMQLEAYGLEGLPNMMDIEEYTPVEEKKWDKTRIVFAPTNNWPVNVKGSKGTNEVNAILEKFKDRCELVIFHNLVYKDNLDRKRHSDIIIDDLVNNTFHKTSIEGACFGLVTITSLMNSGFFFSGLNGLEKDLENLITNQELLDNYKHRSRTWVTTHWNPKLLSQSYIEAYQKLIRK